MAGSTFCALNAANATVPILASGCIDGVLNSKVTWPQAVLNCQKMWDDSRQQTASICVHCTRTNRAVGSKHSTYEVGVLSDMFAKRKCLSCVSPLTPQNEEQAVVLWVWHHWDHFSHLQETKRMHRSGGESQSYQSCCLWCRIDE